jgi:hypothetical protein
MSLALGVWLATGLATIVTGARLVIRASRSVTRGRGHVCAIFHSVGQLRGAMRIVGSEDSDQWATRGSDSMAP